MNTFSDDKTIGLGYKSNVYPRTLTISLNRVEGDFKEGEIYLEDHYLGITHDLNKSDYEFQADKAGEYSDRFRLEFVNKNYDLGPDVIVDADRFTITNEFDMMSVVSGKSVNEIKVYDLLGRMIIMDAPNKSSFQLNTSNVKIGTIMLIEARLEDGSMINTKSIKY